MAMTDLAGGSPVIKTPALTDTQMERQIAMAVPNPAPVAAASASPTFSQAGSVTNESGEVVPVDISGRDANGALVIQGSTFVKPSPVTPVAAVPAKKAIGTQVVTINGQQKQIITFDDGTTVQQDLGTNASDQANRTSIFDAAKAQMTQWGLYKAGDPASEALAKQLQTLATSGAGPDTISLALQNSDAYKARFAGNATRTANGMSALSPKDYIDWENNVQSVLQAAGVPQGFYAGTDEMAKLIGANVNYQVLQSRVDLAAKSIANSDPFYTQQLQNLYGVSQGDMIAHVLDPSVAMPLLQKQVSSTNIAAEAARQGTNINLSTAEQLAGMGVTQAQAQQGFTSIAQQQPALQAILSRTAGLGEAGTVGQSLQSAAFNAPIAGETPAQAEQRIKRATTAESNLYGGSAGASKGSLGISDTSGLS